jgi:pyruvate,water dikinase
VLIPQVEETVMSQPAGERSFPLPSQIAEVHGAEGWEAMYPYFTRFQPEDDQRFWFYNSMHFPEVVPAFDGITSEIPYTAIGANTARLFAFPTTMGIEYRILNGRVYITANPVLDEAKQGERLAHFRTGTDSTTVGSGALRR